MNTILIVFGIIIVIAVIGRVAGGSDAVFNNDNQRYGNHDDDDWMTNPAYSDLAGNIYYSMPDD